MEVFFCLCIGLGVAGLWMLWRNNVVLSEFQRAIDAIHELNIRDIHNDRPYEWRYEALPSYETVLWSVTKHPRSFFDGKPFLDPSK